MLLGNSSWRIRRVQAGRVIVEDAHGAAPNIPFWRGEAPSRTAELSQQVSELREEVDARTPTPPPPHAPRTPPPPPHPPPPPPAPPAPPPPPPTHADPAPPP